MTGESFLDIDTSDAIEPTLVDDGTENLIRIIGYNKQDENIIRESNSGYKYFIVLFDFPNELAAKSFSQIYSVPNPELMDEKQLNRAKWELEIFKRAFGVEGGINFEEIIGNEGWTIIGKKDDKQYGEHNYIKKLLAGN